LLLEALKKKELLIFEALSSTEKVSWLKTVIDSFRNKMKDNGKSC